MVFPHARAEGAPDCLIFDVDGVLVEADKSFPEMIRATVEDAWRGTGFTVDSPGYSLKLNDVFKRHGSFNDDYDIAWTLLNIMAQRTGDAAEVKLSDAMPSPEELEEIISECSGDCLTWTLDSFPERFKRESIREVCIRTYFGEDGQKGMYSIERPLLRSHWSALPLPAYIYTGRNDAEWRLAKEILTWEDFPNDRVIGFDSGIHKPSPEGLARLCDSFGHESPLFFGDTASDRKAWEAFGRGRFVAVGDILRDERPNFHDVEEALFRLLEWRESFEKNS